MVRIARSPHRPRFLIFGVLVPGLTLIGLLATDVGIGSAEETCSIMYEWREDDWITAERLGGRGQWRNQGRSTRSHVARRKRIV